MRRKLGGPERKIESCRLKPDRYGGAEAEVSSGELGAEFPEKSQDEYYEIHKG